MDARVTLVWDGDPEAPDSTAEVDAVRLFFHEEQYGDLPLGVTVVLPLESARQLWGRLGDALREADGEG